MTNAAIEALCEKKRVRYHHHDAFAEPQYLNDPDLKKAVVVVYSSSFGPWTLAINEDGSATRPGDDLRRKALEIRLKIREFMRKGK